MSNEAAIYCRISQDAEGESLGVARQELDCRALAERHGLTIVDVYTDNDTGASTRSRKKHRPEYDRMLDDARTGRVGVILAYSNSRLTRRLRELEDLIVLHERHGTRILTVVSGEDNLSTADGRMVARIKASVDAGEAERTAERVARKHLELAQSGKAVGGRRPFGYNDDKVTLHEVEAALVRQAVADVLAGTRLATIVQQWNAAGVTTVSGTSWTGGQLLQLLRSPRIAGWRIYRPAGTPWTAVPPVAVDKHGEPVRGQWEPIITDATHKRLVAALGAKGEGRVRVPRRNARTYLVTGLLRCAECNALMYGNRQGEAYHYYKCDTKGCGNSASGRGVDEWVGARVVERSEIVKSVAANDSTWSDLLLAANQKIADITELVDDIMRAYRERAIPARVAFANASELEQARDQAVAERDALEAQIANEQPEGVDAAAWEAMDTDQRRAACERSLEAVYVHRATRRGNQFDASRLDPVWR